MKHYLYIRYRNHSSIKFIYGEVEIIKNGKFNGNAMEIYYDSWRIWKKIGYNDYFTYESSDEPKIWIYNENEYQSYEEILLAKIL